MKGSRLQISYHTDRGLVRRNNEDSSLAVPPWHEPAISAGACIFGVADGMGGHAAGEVASGLATSTLKTWLSQQHTERVVGPAEVESAFVEANNAIWDYVKTHPDCQGMGTTLSAGVISSNRMVLCHVGDSRVYLLRGGELRQLTNDHTLVGEQLRAGKISAEAARHHPARHILSRALGVREFISIDSNILDLVAGDVLLFCSDGIYGPLSDESIKEGLARKPFSGAAKRLVECACREGGPDNATAVVVLIDELPVSYPGRYSWSRFKSVLGEWGMPG